MNPDLWVDYAWEHPTPADIRAAGYTGVVRYLSHDPSKDIDHDEVVALHAAGLSVVLVWETTAQRAADGEAAGRADRVEAESRARTLGYPQSCPIFYAVDYDADPAAVMPYFSGIKGGSYPVGVYGSLRVVAGIMAPRLAAYGWQTSAWSGTTVSSVAHLYQRQIPTRGIAHATGGSYDEDVVLRPLPSWGAPPTPEQQLNAAYRAWRTTHPRGTPAQFKADLQGAARARRSALATLHAAFVAWRARHKGGTAAEFTAALRALRRR